MADRALVFAGQGAQYVGMGKDLADAYPECRKLFDKADEVLGYSLSKICFDGPEEDLTKSNHCQPAIFVMSIACWTALKCEIPDLAVKAMAGLSLGEWSALYAAGALSFEDALRVLEARGRFMQEACDERDGGMVSVIGLSREKLDDICVATGVEIANMNSEAQTVLSGEKKGIEEAGQLAKEAGAKRAIVLNVAGAFHSSLMSSAAKRLEEMLAGVEIKEPAVTVLANVTGCPHGDGDEIKANMVKQVNTSVKWLSCVEWCKSNGIVEYVECGPGKVLSGLIKRIDKESTVGNVQDVETLKKTIDTVISPAE
ncbi:MAG: ACP S-malonyltransferase [Kiritimatiellae bacterium]|nr:ACP S-malonyltransferase [Kiritimatiellia bacterium]